MIAEPVPIFPQDDGNFISEATETVRIGDCACPGRPHEQDEAEVYRELPWDVLADAGMLERTAAYRVLVLGGVVSWNLVTNGIDDEGNPASVPVPLIEATVRRLRKERLEPIAGAINAAYERAQAPLPNASGAPSRRSRRESASPNPTIRPRVRHTRSR